MASILSPDKTALGARIKSFKSTQYEKIVELINKVNSISVTASTLKANTITPSTGSNIALTAGVVENHTASAINVTATATAAEIATGLITSTSAAAVGITLPSAASLIALLPGSARGTSFDLIVDNSVGANIVTITPSASITAATAVITGGATLTVASGATGIFRIYFTSTTAAKIYRVG